MCLVFIFSCRSTRHWVLNLEQNDLLKYVSKRVVNETGGVAQSMLELGLSATLHLPSRDEVQ